MENLLIIMNVIFINTLLSSDNAVALAALVLPLERAHRKLAVRWGAILLVVLLVAIAALASSIMSIPGVKVVGGVLLYWISLKLLVGDEKEEQKIRRFSNVSHPLVSVIAAIVAVDLATSLDNVVAIVSAARGNMFDVGVGILVSIPLVLWGSQRIASFLERFPQMVRVGGLILSWVAGQTFTSDPWVQSWLATHKIQNFTTVNIVLALCCCAAAWLWAKVRGMLVARRRSTPSSENR